MTWVVEHLHRDGTVLARALVAGSDFRIGRALDNDLVLDDPHCAAYHAALRIDGSGAATLHDLETRNGIARIDGRRLTTHRVQDDAPFRLGESQIRLRHSSWPLALERPLNRAVWPWAVAALTLALLYVAWTVWLGDVNEKSPPYLYALAGTAAAMAAWSGVYALLGRLISGVERYPRHLLIAACGFLILTAVGNGLELLAFATGWLWPMRIESYVWILIVALVVRAHLRVADPGHWPTLRWAIASVAALAMLVPIAQLWISSQRLTRVQTLQMIEHPSLRLARPSSAQDLTDSAVVLKARVDAARRDDRGDDDDEVYVEE